MNHCARAVLTLAALALAYDAKLIRKSNANFVRWMHVAPKPAPVRAFELFVLKRPGAEGDYGAKACARARRLWMNASAAKRRRITKALLLGLPGTTADATPAGLRPLI